MPRVLLYNWADPYDAEGLGGGVSVYQRNLLEELARRPGWEVTCLSAGLSRSLRGGPPRWERLRGGEHPPEASRAFGAPPRRFRMIDTAPSAPSHHSFADPAQVGHSPTETAFAAFLKAEGPFDVVHFNALEGLPASVLTLIAPPTRKIVSLHNYYAFCPQVNLWQGERMHCVDFDRGRACTTCLPAPLGPAQVRRAHTLMYTLDTLGIGPATPLHRHAIRPAKDGVKAMLRRARAVRVDDPQAAVPAIGTAEAFAARRADLVALLNAHAMHICAVSDRSAALARGFGILPERLRVLRIGTDQAGHWNTTPPPDRLVRADGTLGLGYLGYMRADKGYFFLMDALARLPSHIAGRLHLTIAAAARSARDHAQIEALRPRLASLRHVDGYRRDALPDILAHVDLGIVPSLWEDNLPQTALEMHARRIPLLTSDRGGARELSNAPDFVFRAGDYADLEQRLAALMEPGRSLGPYWASARPPLSVGAHVEALLDLYAAE